MSHRREKKALHPKEKKRKVITEDINYSKTKKKVKLKAEIIDHHDEEIVENVESTSEENN